MLNAVNKLLNKSKKKKMLKKFLDQIPRSKLAPRQPQNVWAAIWSHRKRSRQFVAQQIGGLKSATFRSCGRIDASPVWFMVGTSLP